MIIDSVDEYGSLNIKLKPGMNVRVGIGNILIDEKEQDIYRIFKFESNLFL